MILDLAGNQFSAEILGFQPTKVVLDTISEASVIVTLVEENSIKIQLSTNPVVY
jgi:hypothetical protein